LLASFAPTPQITFYNSIVFFPTHTDIPLSPISNLVYIYIQSNPNIFFSQKEKEKRKRKKVTQIKENNVSLL